jgi:hypothetical protein
MGRLERWTVVSVEVGVGGRTVVSVFLLLSSLTCTPGSRGREETHFCGDTTI